jgi:hypothetical protein
LDETERTGQNGRNWAELGQKTGIFMQKRGKIGQKNEQNRAKPGKKRAKTGKKRSNETEPWQNRANPKVLPNFGSGSGIPGGHNEHWDKL